MKKLLSTWVLVLMSMLALGGCVGPSGLYAGGWLADKTDEDIVKKGGFTSAAMLGIGVVTSNGVKIPMAAMTKIQEDNIDCQRQAVPQVAGLLQGAVIGAVDGVVFGGLGGAIAGDAAYPVIGRGYSNIDVYGGAGAITGGVSGARNGMLLVSRDRLDFIYVCSISLWSVAKKKYPSGGDIHLAPKKMENWNGGIPLNLEKEALDQFVRVK